MEKLGTLVSPLSVVKDGNRNMHAVGSGLYYEGADGSVVIRKLDNPVVSPGERRLLQFDNSFANKYTSGKDLGVSPQVLLYVIGAVSSVN
ncbi:hypothetical protein ACFW1P_03980 [Paenibacillus sp. NPDC058910]|uniref:hypothetical protein n=1 Tax=unclassified Paenibacillus TaxID=185978 RepID=UPI003678C5EC